VRSRLHFRTLSPQSISAFSSSPPFDLTAAIVSYRSPIAQLRRAVESLAQQPVRIRLMLVDNAGETSVAALAEESGAVYLRTQENLGFGKAHNLAYQALRALSPYHLVLNPDVHFGHHVVPPLLQLMAEQPDLGVVMPKILYADGSTQHLCKRLPTPWDLLVRRFGPQFAHRFFQRAMDRYELLDRDYDQPMEPPTLSGCFLLLRNQVIDQVGLFDERFFMYMEDVDLLRRIWSISRALYYPRVAVVHEYQRGSYRDTRLARHHVLSALKYFSKWGWIHDAERRRINQRQLASSHQQTSLPE
jgi:GT2 family glycosyltransferase